MAMATTMRGVLLRGRRGLGPPDTLSADGDVAVRPCAASQPEPGDVPTATTAEAVLERLLLFVGDEGEAVFALEDLDVAERALGLAVADRGPVVAEAPGGFDDRLVRPELEVDAEGLDVHHRADRRGRSSRRRHHKHLVMPVAKEGETSG